MIASAKLLLPEILLSGGAILLLGLDLFLSRNKKPAVIVFSILFLISALVLIIQNPVSGHAFGMFTNDSFSSFFKIVAVFSCLLILIISENDSDLLGSHAGTYASLLILSTVGTMLLSSASDFLMLFVGLELTTIPLFILAGFLRKNLSSNEAAIKFFLIGAFSTGLMLYGISLIYGLCGSTQFSAARDWFLGSLSSGLSSLFILGILFLLIGLGFKLSLVPFHQWTPDTYEGAPTPITAFFSVSREAGVIAVMLRLFSEFINQNAAGMNEIFGFLSVLTMTVGNLVALRQDNIKRLLAYSSIAHAGTIFVGLVAGNQLGREGAMLYSLAYFLMSLGAFSVVIIVSRIRGSEHLDSVQGLAKENFLLAFVMLFSLLSLAGIPPFLGFWGKFYVFAAAIESKLFWLVGIGLVNAVIAVYYYFKIVHKMFFQDPLPNQESIPQNLNQSSAQAVSIFVVAALLLLGIFPQGLLAFVKATAHLLP